MQLLIRSFAAILTVIGFGALNLAGAGCATVCTPSTTVTAIAPVAVTSQYIDFSGGNNREPSCTWSPGPSSGGLPTWVCGTIDSAFVSWSWSVDGITWNFCTNGTAGCGSLPPVPSQVVGLGDPILVADGEGNVVMSWLASSTSGATLVLAAYSNDGGRTFNNPEQVNATPLLPPQSCGAASDDQESADFDLSTDVRSARKVSVIWRHNGAGTFGGCMRRGVFCAAATSDPACTALSGPFPTVAWETDHGLDIGNMDRQDQLFGQSGLIVQAGDGAVTVVYANCDGSMVNCPNTSLQNCGWRRVTTYDGGNSWTSNVHIDDTTTLQTCVVNGGAPPTAGRLENRHRATFAFARDRRSGDYYVGTMHAKGDLRIFRSQNRGYSWEFVKEFQTGPSIAMPTLASDSEGQIALTFLQSDTTDTLLQPVFATAAAIPTSSDPDPDPSSVSWPLSTLTPFFPANPTTGVRDVGDYNTIAVADSFINTGCTTTSRFLPAWTDTLGSDQFDIHAQEVDVVR